MENFNRLSNDTIYEITYLLNYQELRNFVKACEETKEIDPLLLRFLRNVRFDRNPKRLINQIYNFYRHNHQNPKNATFINLNDFETVMDGVNYKLRTIGAYKDLNFKDYHTKYKHIHAYNRFLAHLFHTDFDLFVKYNRNNRKEIKIHISMYIYGVFFDSHPFHSVDDLVKKIKFLEPREKILLMVNIMSSKLFRSQNQIDLLYALFPITFPLVCKYPELVKNYF